MKAASWMYALVGGIISAISLVSFLQHLLNVGLSPVLHEGLGYYRHIAGVIFGYLLGWVRYIIPHWTLPPLYRDLLTISFVGSAGYLRGIAIGTLEQFEEKWDEVHESENIRVSARVTLWIGSTIIWFIVGVSLLGMLAIVFSFVMFLTFFTPKGARDEQLHRKSVLIASSVFGSTAGVAVFFIVNAYFVQHSI